MCERESVSVCFGCDLFILLFAALLSLYAFIVPVPENSKKTSIRRMGRPTASCQPVCLAACPVVTIFVVAAKQEIIKLNFSYYLYNSRNRSDCDCYWRASVCTEVPLELLTIGPHKFDGARRPSRWLQLITGNDCERVCICQNVNGMIYEKGSWKGI